MSALPQSDRLITWDELAFWLFENGYPSRVRVFENSALVSSLVYYSPDESRALDAFCANGATFYVLRISMAEAGYSQRKGYRS
jgi:hypothetical protein